MIKAEILYVKTIKIILKSTLHKIHDGKCRHTRVFSSSKLEKKAF